MPPPTIRAGVYVHVIGPALADRPALAAGAMLVALIASSTRLWATAIPVRACYWLLAIQPMLASLIAMPRLCAYPLGWAAWPPGGLPLLISNLLFILLSCQRWVQRACADALLLPFGAACHFVIGRIAAASQRGVLLRSGLPLKHQMGDGFYCSLVSLCTGECVWGVGGGS